MTEALRLLAVAFQFLTRFPVPGIRVEDGDLRRASAAFPLVGVAVAAVGIAVRALCEPWWGPAPATVAAVGAMVAATGAFHEDGLADSADGLWGGWDPQQRVEIMRDSRIGTYGAAALILSLALKITLLAGLAFSAFAAAVLCGAVLGRASTLVLVRFLPAVSPGTGASVVGSLGLLGTSVAAVTVGVVLAATVGWWSPVVLLACAVAIAACRRLFRRRVGGLVGDALGAANQVTDVVAIAAVAALSTGGHV
jgi:adenosylcobinamide-GDP ribazoletransferase